METLLSDFGTKTYLPFPIIAARLLLGALLGAVIGAEREWQAASGGIAHAHAGLPGGGADRPADD